MRKISVLVVLVAALLPVSVRGQYGFFVSKSTVDALWKNRSLPGGLQYRKLESSLRYLAYQDTSAINTYHAQLAGVQIDSLAQHVLAYVYPDKYSLPYQVDSSLKTLSADSILAFDSASPVTVKASISDLKTIAALPHVGYVRPVLDPVSNSGGGHRPHGCSFGDHIHRCDSVRSLNSTAWGEDDSHHTVMVGLISDDCDYNSPLFKQLQSDTIIPLHFDMIDDSYHGARTHEGLAMADIIHDVAPKAGVVFAQGASDMTTFARNIRRLAAGTPNHTDVCKIICDDLYYPEEPDFEDAGGVWQAIHDVYNQGVFYVTSAGNFARDVYSFDGFTGTPFFDSLSMSNVMVNQFNSSLQYDPIYLPRWETLKISLQWDDHPFAFATHVYNLFLYDLDEHRVVARTTNAAGDLMPALQTLDFANEECGRRLGVIVEVEGKPLDTQKFVLFIHNSDRLSPPFFHNGIRSVMGHAESADVLACAAISAFNEDNSSAIRHTKNSWNTRSIYSSTGQVMVQGSPDRIKPDEAFIDQVSTEVPGFYIFAGTSASAAHAAGLAAMMRSFKPALTPAEMLTAIRTPHALITGTPDPPSKPNEQGYGRADAIEIFKAIQTHP